LHNKTGGKIMKTTKIILLTLIVIMYFGCDKKHCGPSAVDPVSNIGFLFSVVDVNGNDLFFGTDSIYNPNDVKFAAGQKKQDFWIQENRCFVLSCYPVEKSHTIYMEFIPNRIDTIKIKTYFDRYSEREEGCILFEIYKHDIYFNNTLIDKGRESGTFNHYKFVIQ
jgi:hypothetical protein